VTRYRTIVADPPWQVRTPKGWDSNETTNAIAYPMMTVSEIAALPVRAMADDPCHLYLWTVQKYVDDAYDVARAWGFEPKILLTWCKPQGKMLGGLYASTTEFCLFARRGVDGVRGPRHPTTWWEWPRGAHSAKPEAFQDIVESVSPGPYVELFARRARFGWDYWGDQSLGTAEMPAVIAG
jgi:N6-adenosine-specific RNA methylase IME4